MTEETKQNEKEQIAANTTETTNNNVRYNAGASSRKLIEEDDREEEVMLEQFTHPYFDEDPSIGQSRYEPNVLLSRGCCNNP